MSERTKVDVDNLRLQRAIDDLRLHNQQSHADFCALLDSRANDLGATASELMHGLSHGNIKKMRSNQTGWPRKLPYPLIIALFRETGIDVTENRAVQFFEELDFMVSLQLDVPPRNDSAPERDIRELRNLSLTIHEADAIITDEENPAKEIDVKIGFKQMRLSVSAPGLMREGEPLLGENSAELHPETGEGATVRGNFVLRFGGTTPPSWVFEHVVEGRLLTGNVTIIDTLGTVSCSAGANVVAELSARTSALKVRIIDENGSRNAEKPQSDIMREKMRMALVRKAIEGAGDEFVIFHKRLAG